jgi:hypothetical protein
MNQDHILPPIRCGSIGQKHTGPELWMSRREYSF